MRYTVFFEHVNNHMRTVKIKTCGSNAGKAESNAIIRLNDLNLNSDDYIITKTILHG